MFDYSTLLLLLSLLVLFLFGLEQFADELQRRIDKRFRHTLSHVVRSPSSGVIVGLLASALFQSNTLTVLVTASLVDAGFISFFSSLGILLGAQIGGALTAQFVAFQWTAYAPLFLLSGFLLTLAGGMFRFVGKPLFYIGLVFFSLHLLASHLSVLHTDPDAQRFFSLLEERWVAFFVGFGATALVQSSAIVSGLLVLLGVDGLISLPHAIAILLGVKLGSTITAIIVAPTLSLHARRTAYAHVCINLFTVLLFFPLIDAVSEMIASLGGNLGMQIANAYVFMSVATALFLFPLLSHFARFLSFIVPGNEPEILFTPRFLSPSSSSTSSLVSLDAVERELTYSLDTVISIFAEANTMLTTRTERFKHIHKLESLSDYLDETIEQYLLSLSHFTRSPAEAERIALLVRMSNEIEHLGDFGKDFGRLARMVLERNLSFSPPALAGLEAVYGQFYQNATTLRKYFPRATPEELDIMRKNDIALQRLITKNYEEHILRSGAPLESSMFVELLSVIESANDKMRDLRKLTEHYTALYEKSRDDPPSPNL